MGGRKSTHYGVIMDLNDLNVPSEYILDYQYVPPKVSLDALLTVTRNADGSVTHTVISATPTKES